MDRRDEIEFLRQALRRRVEQTSVRHVAAEARMSHGGVYNFVTKNEVPYGKTLARLRAWYLEHWAQGSEGLSLEAARYLIAEMLGAIPRDDRLGAGMELLDAIEAIHRHHEMPPPAWLHELRREWRASTGSGSEPEGGAD
jgi:AcrR family transcriptional regulator